MANCRNEAMEEEDGRTVIPALLRPLDDHSNDNGPRKMNALCESNIAVQTSTISPTKRYNREWCCDSIYRMTRWRKQGPGGRTALPLWVCSSCETRPPQRSGRESTKSRTSTTRKSIAAAEYLNAGDLRDDIERVPSLLSVEWHGCNKHKWEGKE